VFIVLPGRGVCRQVPGLFCMVRSVYCMLRTEDLAWKSVDTSCELQVFWKCRTVTSIILFVESLDVIRFVNPFGYNTDSVKFCLPVLIVQASFVCVMLPM
jgi:hypothetical protein